MSDWSAISNAIASNGWIVTRSGLADAILHELANEARDLRDRQLLHPAGVGRSERHLVEREIRGDLIRWVTADARTPSREAWLGEIESIRLELNEALFLGLETFEGQFAFYPPGTGYDRHLDRFSNAGERTISCLLYLNENWTESDGGALRIYLDGGHLDVLPVLGTMVLFRSELIEHEVLTACRDRYSLTGWFRRRSLRDVIEGRGVLPGTR